LHYAGFWIRVLARAIDFLVMLPVVLFFEWVLATTGRNGVPFLIPYGFFVFIYFPYFHARTGQTLGKRATGLRVVASDGASIGWGESLGRSAVDGLWTVIWCGGLAVAIGSFSKQAMVVPWHHYMKALESYMPLWYHKVIFAMGVWWCMDIVALLASKEKRSLHDLIGGTKVVVLPKEAKV